MLHIMQFGGNMYVIPVDPFPAWQVKTGQGKNEEASEFVWGLPANINKNLSLVRDDKVLSPRVEACKEGA